VRVWLRDEGTPLPEGFFDSDTVSLDDAGESDDQHPSQPISSAALTVPIVAHGGELIGALLLGSKRSEEPYTANDRSLLRAIARGVPASAIVKEWEAVRDRLLDAGAPSGKDLVSALQRALDDVRREWIAAERDDWVRQHVPYCGLDELRRRVGEPGRALVVTTKEGEFARLILDHWQVRLADVQGKETGVHKCENLRALIAEYATAHGRRPALWFVEDRLETLQHVTTHADLADVGLFLATWGYNTPETREAARRGGRVRLLGLDQFRHGLSTWL